MAARRVVLGGEARSTHRVALRSCSIHQLPFGELVSTRPHSRALPRVSGASVRALSSIVTTPLFYVNASPHIGHAHSIVLSDTVARCQRFEKESTVLVCGSDEHGQKISQAARAIDFESEQAFCDVNSREFQDLVRALGANSRSFVRTTDEDHKKTVELIWERIKSKMRVEKYEGWYCASDECYVPLDRVNSQSRLTLEEPCKRVEWTSEENYIFEFDAEKIRKRVDEEMEIFPASRKNEVNSWFNELANPDSPQRPIISMSRPTQRVSWAIPVPSDPSQGVYVWLDALSGYATAWRRLFHTDFQRDTTHVVGKDILRFHAVYWPAILDAAGLPLPKRLIAHAHWTSQGIKMSKSLGNVVHPLNELEYLTKKLRTPKAEGGAELSEHDASAMAVDALRWYLMREATLENDADFQVGGGADSKFDTDVADGVGNLVHRVFGLWRENLPQTLQADPANLLRAGEEVRTARAWMMKGEVSKGLDIACNIVNRANSEFHNAAPWQATMLPAARATILAQALVEVKAFLDIAHVVAPFTCEKLYRAIHCPAGPKQGADWIPRRPLLSEDKASRQPIVPKIVLQRVFAPGAQKPVGKSKKAAEKQAAAA